MLIQNRDTIIKPFVNIQKTIVIITFVITVIIVSGASILRYVFNTDLSAYEEVLLISAFWLYMMGGTLGSYEDSHIKADILQTYLKGMTLDVVTLFRKIATTVLSGVFFRWSITFVQWSLFMGAKTPVHQIPRIIGESSIFFGLLFMTIYHAIYAYDEIVFFIRKYFIKKKAGE